MDLDDLNIFEILSTGTFALLSGVLIIATLTYFIYSIYPLLEGNMNGFIYSIVALALGVIASLFFFLEDLTGINDIIGKFISGISISVFVVLLLHIYTSFDLDSLMKTLPHVFISGILGFVTSLFLVRGVMVPAFGGYSEPESKGWSYQEPAAGESDEPFGSYEESEETFEEGEGSETFPEEEEEPW